MTFSDRVPSNEWAALKYKGETLAEVWFKPHGDPLALEFRVPRNPSAAPDAAPRLTLDALLRAVAVPTGDVESWRLGDDSHAAAGAADPELKRPLPPAPADATHLTITVRLKSPTPAAAPEIRPDNPGGTREVPPEVWQTLEVRWQAILGLEAGIEASRLGMESLRSELEAAYRKTLGVEEKVHALQADVAQWNKARNRVHYVLPKVREFIHRATWAVAVPERKSLEEIVKKYVEPRVPFPELDRFRERLDHLQKDRQVLSAQGSAVYQECRAIAGEVQRALGTLQRNAADRARAKRSAAREKGKHG